jgi:deoxyribodipyrimidine photo-lyase
MNKEVAVFWFRRDLRLYDNAGLYEALRGNYPVLPLFIFDAEILDDLPRDDARVTFIYRTLQRMRDTLQREYGGSIATFHGNVHEVFVQLLTDYRVKAVYTNCDYEPYARKRDGEVNRFLQEKGIPFYTFKDQVIFEKAEVTKASGDPYVVFTPYMKKWKEAFTASNRVAIHASKAHLENVVRHSRLPNLALTNMDFQISSLLVPEYSLSPTLLKGYEKNRNFPAKDETSYLGPHLRFGTVSIRQVMRKAFHEKSEAFLNELIWREFFMQIIWHFPNTVQDSFKKKYDRINWRNSNADFKKWKEGKTGYALVDAGIRQLNNTGFMHNRVRMVVASFLCKHLLIDWRWGEAYFAEKLLDYELSSNVGNWQWAAGSGVDAAPYFRIFNPQAQLEKFDKDKKYVRHWVPEYGTDKYPGQIVDHKEARERCLHVYKAALG